ncbi:P-loop containing nucleoside triphosphate hydrolase protein [Gymnopus androsaceus JB14]|uniref:Ribosome assembly protein 1 n=1 Tax=Gymnopus androsaceus JB14 TaxID=1447944 RepID=A0A6A4H808_9AGAR|nr:P-loop containing nucleoside triphosphate hydrolase protein [Gymnopus androsaceus JB14]
MSHPQNSQRQHIRNLTTLGHVDHGKTTLMDSLLASNNIISSRMAGKMRYMDSREDEQERGITMEASAVGLKFRVAGKNGDTEQYILNMIDTPGHVDFSSQVSSASRLCDGALIIIDVVEGVCTQTISVLKQAFEDQLEMVLVMNKMDRLITELRLSPEEAHERLKRVIEDVNAVMGGLWGGKRMREADAEATTAGEQDEQGSLEEDSDEGIYFDPSKGNVIFSSAIDGWGFRPSHFARIFAKRLFPHLVESGKPEHEAELRKKEESLKKVMWGEWYFDSKTKRVMPGSSKGKKPLFVQIVLDNLWMVYESVIVNPNPDKVLKIISTLSLSIPQRELRSISNLTSTTTTDNTYAKHLLTLIFSSWLPLSTSIVQAVIDIVPEPGVAQGRRMQGILGLGGLDDRSKPNSSMTRTRKSLEHLFSADASLYAPVAVYVSKMFAVKRGELPEHKAMSRVTARERTARSEATRIANTKASEDETTAEAKEQAQDSKEKEGTATPTSKVNSGLGSGKKTTQTDDDAEEEILLGFARIYSGTLNVEDTVYVVLPRFNTRLQGQAKESVTRNETGTGSQGSYERIEIHPSNVQYVLGLNDAKKRNEGSGTPRKMGKSVRVRALYLMMGRELVPVEKVQAGEIFAVRLGYGSERLTGAGVLGREGDKDKNYDGEDELDDGVETGVGEAGDEQVEVEDTSEEEILWSWRTGSIVRPGSESRRANVTGAEGKMEPKEEKEWLINLGRVNRIVTPIVRVALLPVHPGDLPALLKGLRILEQADPCVDVFQMPGGEWVIGGAGEMHLERCLKDLRERYAQVEFHASKPIVPFRETAVRFPQSVAQGEASGKGSSTEGSGPTATQRQFQVSQFGFSGSGSGPMEENELEEGQESKEERTFWREFEEVCRKASSDKDNRDKEDASLWLSLCQRNRAWAFGPQAHESEGDADAYGAGCILVDARNYASNSLLQDTDLDLDYDFTSHIETGFQLATRQGPLCAEPVEGRLEEVEGEIEQNRLAQTTGSLTSSIRDACKSALLEWSPRLMLAMYSCDIQCSTDVLGKVYAVVSKRKGRIVAEEMKEGTSFFTITARLPVVESFGFADDIRKRTSGAASPMLVFSGYDLLPLSPFWVPTTEEELEDLGTTADKVNIAKVYMDTVRERKGMFVDRKIVEHAEKQRTLKK